MVLTDSPNVTDHSSGSSEDEHPGTYRSEPDEGMPDVVYALTGDEEEIFPPWE